MKAVIFIICLLIISTSFAAEVSTDCLAMDEITRQKNVKATKPKPKTDKGASAQ